MRKLNRARLLVIGGTAALALAALTVAPAIGGPSLKKLVKKEVRKQLRGKEGPAGQQGIQGIAGQNGVPGAPGQPVTNHIVLTDTSDQTVLTFEGFTVTCQSHPNRNLVKVEAPAFIGNVQYNLGTSFITAPVSNTGGGGADFGSNTSGTARYQVINTAGPTAPTRVATITVTILVGTGSWANGGPHCIAEASVGPA